MGSMKQLDRLEANDGIETYGDPDRWVLVCKAWSHGEGWMKSTKAMQIGGGVLVQVTTQQKNPDGTYALSEAMTFVPGGAVVKDIDTGLVEVVEMSQIGQCTAEPPELPQKSENEPPRLFGGEDSPKQNVITEEDDLQKDDENEETQEVGDAPAESWDEVTD